MQEDNKLRVNPKYLVHYTLAQIVYINNYYNIYKALKEKNYKYLVRIYQMPSKLKYRNTKFIYGWHLIEKQQVKIIMMEPGNVSDTCSLYYGVCGLGQVMQINTSQGKY